VSQSVPSQKRDTGQRDTAAPGTTDKMPLKPKTKPKTTHFNLMPTPKKPVALLQPLAATDPLALLFNDWLACLAPVECFTRPRPSGRPDAENEHLRGLLLGATTALHDVHRALAKAVTLLGQDAPLSKLAPLFRPAGSDRPGIGSCPTNVAALLDYAALQDSITSRAACKRIMRYRPLYRFKLAEIASEQPHLERTYGLLLAVFDATSEAEQDHHFLQPDDHAGRSELLTLLQGIVALDCFVEAESAPQ